MSVEEEAIIVAFRRHTLLPLDDCLYAPQSTIATLTRLTRLAFADPLLEDGAPISLIRWSIPTTRGWR